MTASASAAAYNDPPAPAERAVGGPAGTALVYRFELGKLAAQRRVWVLGSVCLVAPFLFVVALRMQTSVPADTLFGRWSLTSGFATSLLVLGFTTAWALPLLTGLVAGDIFSSEDQQGTWKTVLTRSRSRNQVFVGKVLAATTCSVVVLALVGLSSTAAGILLVGPEPLQSLSGTLLPPGRALTVVLLAWASIIPPVLGFTALAVLLSVTSRSSVVGIGGPVVLGLGSQLGSLVGGPSALRDLSLTTALTSWHGLVTAPTFLGPLVRGGLVSTCWVVLFLAVSHELFVRRDFVGG